MVVVKASGCEEYATDDKKAREVIAVRCIVLVLFVFVAMIYYIFNLCVGKYGP